MLLLRLCIRVAEAKNMSVRTNNEWSWRLAYIIGRFIKAEKYIRLTQQSKNMSYFNEVQAHNAELIGFLQVMKPSCYRRGVKITDPYNPSNTNIFKDIHFLFIVKSNQIKSNQIKSNFI